MATIHDVARAAGVSTATVSRSFTTKHPLNQETRKRVLQEADKLNYRPRRSSASSVRRAPEKPANGVSVSIGFQYFFSSSNDRLPTNAFYGPVLAGAQAEADALGMNMMLHTTHRHMLVRALPQMIAEQAVGGMLLVGTADPEVVDQFLKFVPRIVIVDNRDPQNSHDCVITDGFNGARLAVSHLLKMGHRRIGFLKSRQLDVSFCDRLNGYLCTLFQAGLELDRSLIWEIDEPEISTDMSAEVGQITNYLKDAGDNRPTGIVAVNDAHALALLHACRLMRISVPNEMSIVGFDDTDFSAHTFPALTTVRVDKEEMGRMAVRRLHRRMTEDMDGAGSNPAVVVQLPVALIERSSSGMAPAAR